MTGRGWKYKAYNYVNIIQMCSLFEETTMEWLSEINMVVIAATWNNVVFHGNKHEALSQRCFNIGPPSSTSVQH